MALSAEFGFYLIAPPAPLSGINILSCPSSRSRNCLTIPPLPMSCCVATRGSDSLCWLHPVLSPRRRAVPKRKWVQFRFSRDCSVRMEASDVASQSSEQLSAEDRGSPRYFPSKDGNLSPASSRQYGSAAPSGMSSARPFDLLSNAPTYPSSDDKQLSFKGGTAVGKSGIVSVSSDKFISPRQIFRSIGSRSVSSRPSIPGKFSKYSKRGNSKRIFDKNPSNRKYLHSKVAVLDSHEVSSSEELDSSFTRQSKPEDNSMPIPATSFHADQQSSFPPRRQFAKKKPEIFTDPATMPASELPFEFQFSYSETPKLNPIGFREPQFSPFGPTTMPRPWTGRAPLPKSKKKPKELDTFNPPPPGKKGVKAVHPPGPYKGGEGPKIAQSREEILGEPLTKEEITRLVEICNKEQRQINLGRDGLVHNMLDLIHCHWKRRRVIKIKCKGVPTVDMDNVCYHVEDKSGGKIIHRAGGAMYLFRGRNYNTKYRPQIPLMLWKPAAPIYPKLIVPAPGGLTKEEADAMRKRGRKVQPICKLAKNGVYLNLVKDVRSAFEIDELVRVDCTGLNPSDYKKIGAKLKDLVPCVLLSFDKEHILMWRGNDWKCTESGSITASNLEVEKKESLGTPTSDFSNLLPAFVDAAEDRSGLVFLEAELAKEATSGKSTDGASYDNHLAHREVIQVNPATDQNGDYGICERDKFNVEPQKHSKLSSDKVSGKAIKARNDDASDLDTLWEQAVSMGDALPLEENCLDPDTVFQRAAVLKDIKSVGDSSCLELDGDHERKKTENLKSTDEQHNSSNRFYEGNSDQDRNLSPLIMAEPLGSLPVDELAKLLGS